MPGKTLQTITTIELSSVCQLACRYCVNRLMPKHGREPGIMSGEVFARSLSWLQILCDQGTQREVNLNGNGESCLDQQLPARVRAVRDIVGSRRVAMSTNGINMTARLAAELKDAGIDQIDISPHSIFHARRAVQILREVGIPGVLNMGSLLASHNWAGQLEPENSVPIQYSLPCEPLIEGRGYIQSHGGLSPCCYDYRGLGQFGTVFDEDLLEREIKAYTLCKTCHQNIIEEDEIA